MKFHQKCNEPMTQPSTTLPTTFSLLWTFVNTFDYSFQNNSSSLSLKHKTQVLHEFLLTTVV